MAKKKISEGEKLKRWRNQMPRWWSLERMAMETGYSRRAIQNWEGDKNKIPPHVWLVLAALEAELKPINPAKIEGGF